MWWGHVSTPLRFTTNTTQHPNRMDKWARKPYRLWTRETTKIDKRQGVPYVRNLIYGRMVTADKLASSTTAKVSYKTTILQTDPALGRISGVNLFPWRLFMECTSGSNGGQRTMVYSVQLSNPQSLWRVNKARLCVYEQSNGVQTGRMVERKKKLQNLLVSGKEQPYIPPPCNFYHRSMSILNTLTVG